jgi:hypothetical protein
MRIPSPQISSASAATGRFRRPLADERGRLESQWDRATTSPPTTCALPSSGTARSSSGSWQPEGRRADAFPEHGPFDPRLLGSAAAGAGVAAPGYVGLVTGACPLDLGIGRRVRPVGPQVVYRALRHEAWGGGLGMAV